MKVDKLSKFLGQKQRELDSYKAQNKPYQYEDVEAMLEVCQELTNQARDEYMKVYNSLEKINMMFANKERELSKES